MRNLKIAQTETAATTVVVNVSASYSGGPGFKSRGSAILTGVSRRFPQSLQATSRDKYLKLGHEHY